MIPVEYMGYLFGGLCALAVLMLAFVCYAWCNADEIERDDE